MQASLFANKFDNNVMYDNLVISYVFSKHGMHITFPFFSRLRDPMNFSPQTEQRSEP